MSQLGMGKGLKMYAARHRGLHVLPCQPHAHAPCRLFSPVNNTARGVSCKASDPAGDIGPIPSQQNVLSPYGLANMDENQLQTALVSALEAEDYHKAAALRDRLSQRSGGQAPRIDWEALGLPDWLTSRVEQLGFRFPTEIQRAALPQLLTGRDGAIRSQTGSGKTLAFLLPALAALAATPEVYADESKGPPVWVAEAGGRRWERAVYQDDLKGPEVLVLVPTLELGAQLALLCYRLLGGNISARRPGDSANIYRYRGPRGVKVKGLLTKEEVVMAKATTYLRGVAVVIATPAAALETYKDPQGVPMLDYLRAVAVDEADACAAGEQGAALAEVLEAAAAAKGTGQKPHVVLVGATVGDAAVEAATAAGWLRDPVLVTAPGEQTRQVPGGLVHRYVACDPSRRLAVAARLLRRDLEEADADRAPARAVVFAADSASTEASAEPLRAALWGRHRMAVLLPRGFEPITALHAFRDNAATLLLTSPHASRGLDLPAVSHVYSLAPPADAAEYLHRAGRTGRIGSTLGGIVTTLLSEEEVPELLRMAESLGLELRREEEPPAPQLSPETTDTETARLGLEDLYSLM